MLNRLTITYRGDIDDTKVVWPLDKHCRVNNKEKQLRHRLKRLVLQVCYSRWMFSNIDEGRIYLVSSPTLFFSAWGFAHVAFSVSVNPGPVMLSCNAQEEYTEYIYKEE